MKDSALYVGSVGKAFAVLACFNTADADLSLTELVERSGFDKSAAQRYAYTLCAEGYLEQHVQTRRYRLGKRVLDLTFHFLRTHALVESLNPVMLELSRATGEKISLSLLDGHDLVHVMRHQSATEHYHGSLVGRRVPLFCTAGGRAVLSHMDDTRRSNILHAADRSPWTPHTRTSITDITHQVRLTRERGYGLVHDEFIVGEVGLGVAVLGSEGEPLGALHLAGSSSQWQASDYAERFAPALLNAIGQYQHRNVRSYNAEAQRARPRQTRHAR